MKRLICITCTLLITIGWQASLATEIVYTPVNPSFGGNPLNGSFLLNKATSQNNYKEESSSHRDDPLTAFEDNVTRRVLSALASNIVDSTFGIDGDLATGTYDVGDYTITVTDTGGDVSVSITDRNTGDKTTVEVPSRF